MKLNVGPRLAAIFAVLAMPAWAAEPAKAGQATTNARLSLDEFLGAVRTGNQDYRAAEEGEAAAKLYSVEGSLIYSPQLVGSAQYSDDARHSFLPTFVYDKIITESYSLGIEQMTSIGLKGKFSYVLNDTSYYGMTPSLPTFVDARPTLELSQSLWRNDFGRETRAQVKALTSAAKATQYSEGFNRQNQVVQAELAYWRLALARQNEELTRENMTRAERIFGWAKRRVDLSLADRSDLLQATTVLQMRKLELKKATDDLRSAALNFNIARGIEGDQVSETLESISVDLVNRMQMPTRQGDRQDVMAAQQQTEAVKAQAIINREKNQPNLEVFGAYGFNSRKGDKEDAISASWSNDKPTRIIGVRFSSPLAFGKMADTQEGYARQIKAAEQRLDRQRFMQEQNWRDLAQRFQEAKMRLVQAEELEKNQRAKLDYERQRQENGRTTLFQVISYETDFSSAQGLRLTTLAELLQIAAQMKLYGVQ